MGLVLPLSRRIIAFRCANRDICPPGMLIPEMQRPPPFVAITFKGCLRPAPVICRKTAQRGVQGIRRAQPGAGMAVDGLLFRAADTAEVPVIGPVAPQGG